MAGEIYLFENVINDVKYNLKNKLTLELENKFNQKEIEIIHFLYQGLSTKIIADKMLLAVKTIEWYRAKIFKKTKSKNIANLMHFIFTQEN